MKKIAIVGMSVALPGEKGYSKPDFIARFLSENGYDVTMYTTTFHHWSKSQRKIDKLGLEQLKYKVKFAYQPSYKKNIDLKRIYSYKILAKNIAKLLNEEKEKYDAIYLIIPPNDVGVTVCKYAKKHNIPVIVDVMDLWPEAMRMVIDIPVVSDILFYPFKRDAEKVYSMASGIIGSSDEYRDRPFKYQNLDIPKETIYVGNVLEDYDAGVREYSPQIDKPDGEYWITYAGTLGESYDISTMIDAAAELKSKGYDNIKFKILGGGPTEESLKKQANSLDCNVEFVGYAIYPKMAAYLAKSDVLVNSFVKKAPQSIVTKIGDYLAAGVPMINTCSSPEFIEKVIKDNFGINIEAEDKQILVNAILELYNDKEHYDEMSKNARKIAEEEFDRPTSYLKLVDMIKKMIGE